MCVHVYTHAHVCMRVYTSIYIHVYTFCDDHKTKSKMETKLRSTFQALHCVLLPVGSAVHPHPSDYCCPPPWRAEVKTWVMSPFERGPSRFYPGPPIALPVGNPLSHAESGATVSVKDTCGRRGLRAHQRWRCYCSICFTWRSPQRRQQRTGGVCGIVFPQEANRTWRKKQRECREHLKNHLHTWEDGIYRERPPLDHIFINIHW